jgi:uncharacterized membrane protein
MFWLTFMTPAALALLVLVPLLWAPALLAPRRSSPARMWASLVLRTLIACALIFSVAGVQVVRPVHEVTTVFLLDQSDSVAPAQRDQAVRFVNQSLEQMPAGDQAAVVVFGENALVERAPAALAALGRIDSVPVTSRTNIRDAVQLALALFPAETQKRIVLVSDGGENEGRAADAARLAAVRGVPIDTVLLASQRGPDVLIAQIDAPASAREGQEISLEVVLSSSIATSARLQVLIDGQIAAEQDLTLEVGTRTVAVRVPAGEAGFRRLEARIEAQGDSEPQNNRVAAFTIVQGPPRLLLIASEPARAANLQAALTSVNVRTTLVSPAEAPATLEQLGDYAGVVVVDTPARAMPRALLQILPAYVQDLGRGFAMIGGVDSFGAGGYRRAPADAQGRSIEDILPVSLDPLDTSKQPDLAMVMVIDRSGSMDEPSSSSGRTKLDLAKEAVYQASLGLTQRDQIGLVVFDDTAQWVLPLRPLPPAVDIEQALGSFNADGGTNIRPGVDQAARALAQANAKIKHVLLLTDGIADSNYSDLVDTMRAQGITISAIAIGTDANPNLSDVARRGGGRFLRVERADEVPSLFLQETVIVAGRDIVEQPISPVVALQAPIVRGLASVPQLYGYNGVESKQAARTILTTPDGKPLLAQWQSGLGRGVAWTSDLQGKWARDWVTWDQFPRFVGALTDMIVAPPDSGALSLRSTTEGAQTQLELEARDPQGRPLNGLALRANMVDPQGAGKDLRFTQVGPGRYRAVAETGNPGVYIAQVAAVDGQGQAVGTTTGGIVVSYSLEYSEQRDNPLLLRDLAAISGGVAEPAPAAVWEPTPQAVGAVRDIGLPLLWLALLLWPLDIATRRLMLHLGDLAPWLARRRALRGQQEQAAPGLSMSRLSAAKRRADLRTPAAPLAEAPAPAAEAQLPAAAHAEERPPEAPAVARHEPPSAVDQFARLMAAKQRARKRQAK